MYQQSEHFQPQYEQPPVPLRANEGWREATTRFIRGEVRDVNGLLAMAARAGAIWRTIQTRGIIAAALATEGFAVLTPMPGDEVINIPVIAITGITGAVGVIKQRNQIKKERQSAIASYNQIYH